MEHKDLRPGEKRGVDFKRRVLRRCTNQDDIAAFDPGEERVLLRLVEAVDLVDEHDRAPAGITPPQLGCRHDLLDVLDAREDGAELDEVRPGHVRHDAPEGGLAGTGWSPQDDRVQHVALDRVAQGPARREDVILPDELIQGAGPHAVGEGSTLLRPCLRRPRRRFVVEEGVAHDRCRRAA